MTDPQPPARPPQLPREAPDDDGAPWVTDDDLYGPQSGAGPGATVTYEFADRDLPAAYDMGGGEAPETLARDTLPPEDLRGKRDATTGPPPPTPPTRNPGRLARLAGWLHAPFSPTPPQPRMGGLLGSVRRQVLTGLAPAGAFAWWLAERGWRHPLLWGALVAGTVKFTSVTAGHIALLVAALGALAILTPGTGVTRGERVTSVLRWSSFRNRRRRVKRRSVRMWANSGLSRASTHNGGPKRKPKIKRVQPHPLGVSLKVDGSEVGVYVRDVVAHADELCSTVGARSLRAYPIKAREGGFRDHLLELRPYDYMKFRLDFKFAHPFPRPIAARDLPAPARRGFVVIGMNEDLRPMEIDPRMSRLIIGASGSGKSSELWAFLRGLRKAGIPFRLRVFDPKGGTELRELEPIAYHYERLPARWANFMARAGRALEHRQHAMRGAGVRTADLYDERFVLDIMVIDELLTVLTMASTGEMEMFGDRIKIRDALPTYISQVRSANTMVFALSVSAEKEVVASRDLFTYVSCLRVPQQATSTIDMLFGAGSHKAYPAHELIPATKEGPNDAGIGWMRVEKEGVMMYRGGFLTDAEREAEAAKIGRWTAKFTPTRPDPAEMAPANTPSAPRKGRTRRSGAARAARMNPSGTTRSAKGRAKGGDGGA